MYCPKCKGEYREGFFECADCKVPLVADLPPEEEKEKITLVNFMEIRDEALLSLIQATFESEQIAHFVVGGYMLNAGSLHGGRPAELLVDSKEVERAREIVSQINWEE